MLHHLRERQQLRLSRQPRQRTADRVAAGRTEAGRKVEQRLAVDAITLLDALQDVGVLDQ